ncbi:unnamed protein product [Alopecurus aequalis]
MEPAEDASLEPAIQWLADSILASPLIHGHAPWVREAGLAEEMEGLKSEVKGVRLVVSAVKGRALGNVPLAESLVDVKELLYDADDAVDELDYRRLLQLDQEDDQAVRSTQNADVPTTSGTLTEPPAPDGHNTHLIEMSGVNAAAQNSYVGKLRSKLWKEFEIIEFEQNGAPARAKCIHCKTELACPTKQGTGVLQNHLKSKACLNKKREGSDPLSTADATTNPAPPVATDSLSSKKRRRDEESTSLVTANTNLWNKDDFSKMIRDITLKLRHIREGLIPVLTILGPDFSANSNHSQDATSDQRRRTSAILQGTVYGREHEKNRIIQWMEISKSVSRAIVLPIVGIAGVGKTALAQLVYNHPAVKDQFDHLVWIWVSNSFDAMELTKDMLGYVSKETDVGLCNFSKLQEILKSHIKSKRVLLILDDVRDGISDYQWNQLLAPFNSDNVRGTMIIVTTRKPCVAKRRGTVGPIKLGALDRDCFWLYFEACAFGDVKHEKGDSLSNLGEQIAHKLKGNPLAAETAGALLSEHRTVSHWSSILKNEDWKSLTLSGGIMSSLKLCYDQLPYHLQQCFWYCSLFPCNSEFLEEELVRIWISQGFVKCNNSSKRLVEIGQDYLAALVNLGFFEQLEKKTPLYSTQISYVMDDLMHDFARVVSRTECATIDGLQCNRMFPTVRHLSISRNSIYQRDDHTGNIARKKLEEIFRSIATAVGKLRSLVLIGRYDYFLFQLFQTVLQKAHNLRLLHFSVTSADYRFSLCNSVNLARVRYLKVEQYHAEQIALTQVLRNSFHLQVLDVIETIHLLDNFGEPVILSLERLPCLTRLKLRNLESVTEVFVSSLEELVLFGMPNLKICSSTPLGDLKSSLRVLEVWICPVFEVFYLFKDEKAHNLEFDPGLTFDGSWEGFARFTSLEKLTISLCPKLFLSSVHNDGQADGRWLLPQSLEELFIDFYPHETLRPCFVDNVTLLKKLEVSWCERLKSVQLEFCREMGYLRISNCRWLTALGGLRSLVNLKGLNVLGSPVLASLAMSGDCSECSQLSALESLVISELSLLTSAFCEGLSSLRSLFLGDFEEPRLTAAQEKALLLHGSLQQLLFFNCSLLDLPAGLHSLHSLKTLKIKYCNGISGLPNEGLPPSLEELDIEGCSSELSAQCRSLATDTLRVKIDGLYV